MIIHPMVLKKSPFFLCFPITEIQVHTCSLGPWVQLITILQSLFTATLIMHSIPDSPVYKLLQNFYKFSKNVIHIKPTRCMHLTRNKYMHRQLAQRKLAQILTKASLILLQLSPLRFTTVSWLPFFNCYKKFVNWNNWPNWRQNLQT